MAISQKAATGAQLHMLETIHIVLLIAIYQVFAIDNILHKTRDVKSLPFEDFGKQQQT
jgi:hypothetical protein